MGSLKHNLSLRVSQRQILTPGLVQMGSVLALNKLELKDMINAEIVENPVLEELEDSVPLLDQATGREEERAAAAAAETIPEKKDPFDEIDFGSYFQDYLDPGYKSRAEMEEIERPSFEAFLSKAPNLTDHLMWQLGSLSLSPPVREAADTVVGNLNEDGYLLGTDEELLGLEQASFEIIPEEKVRGGAKAALGNPALANPDVTGLDLSEAEARVTADAAASSAFDYLSNYSAQNSLDAAVSADAIFPGVLVPAIDMHASAATAAAPAASPTKVVA